MLKDLADDGFDYIVCDSPAGIEKGAFLAMYFADQAVVVVNPEVSSVRDSDRILGLLASKTRRAENGERVKEHLLLTRYSPKRVETGEMLSIADVEEILGLKTIGVIPESRRRAQRLQQGRAGDPRRPSPMPARPTTTPSRACSARTRPMRFTTAEKKGFFSKLFGG